MQNYSVSKKSLLKSIVSSFYALAPLDLSVGADQVLVVKCELRSAAESRPLTSSYSTSEIGRLLSHEPLILSELSSFGEYSSSSSLIGESPSLSTFASAGGGGGGGGACDGGGISCLGSGVRERAFLAGDASSSPGVRLDSGVSSVSRFLFDPLLGLWEKSFPFSVTSALEMFKLSCLIAAAAVSGGGDVTGDMEWEALMSLTFVSVALAWDFFCWRSSCSCFLATALLKNSLACFLILC